MWLRWVGRLFQWLIREWIAGVVGVVLIVLGLLPESVEGPAAIEFFLELSRSDEARLGLVFVGLALISGAVYGNFFSYSKLKEQLRKVLDDLTNDNIHVRMHAIAELFEISRKSRRIHARAMDSLAYFVRSQFATPEVSGRTITIKKERFGPPNVEINEQRGPDIHQFAADEIKIARRQTSDDAIAAIEAIAGRRRFFDDPRRWIDLSLTDLPSANLEHADLGQISFAGAYLRHARFDGAKLRRTCFAGAIVTEARFDGADLRDASFACCRGHRLYMDRTKLKGATFFGADLYDAYIQSADARDTDFMAANLWRLDGGATDYRGANFVNADLRGASLHHARNLGRDQIVGHFEGMGAIVDKNTRLPWSTDAELRAAGVIRLPGSPSHRRQRILRSWVRWLRGIARKIRP